MSFWDLRKLFGWIEDEPGEELQERKEQAEEIATSKEEHYRAMKALAAEAGDEDGVRHYERRLADVENLRQELELIFASRSRSE